MKTEIETRFLDINKKALVLLLNKLGAENKGEDKLDEIIFYDKDLKWLNENKFIRLRKKNGQVKLTYKHNKHQTVDSAQEIEMDITDMDKMKQILIETGLTPYRIIEKFRHTFELDGVILDIDTWPKIPVYVELEGKSVDDLKKVAAKLGLDWEKRFDGDARFVYKKYGFDFDNLKTVTFSKFE
jgi:adenylate cyclase, class 2